MNRLPAPRLALSLSLALLTALPITAQRRAAQPEPKDFGAAVTQAKTAFDAEDYATALALLAEATKVAQARQKDKIYAAMPEVAGLKREPRPKEDESNAAAAALLGSIGMGALPIEQRYEGDGGKSLTISVTPSSPAMAMYKMMLQNPALLATQEGQELIEYDGYKAVLDTHDKENPKITVLVGDKSTIEAQANNLTTEQLLAAMSQKNVDALAGTLLPKKSAK